MNPDRIILVAQVGLAVAFIVGYFIVLAMFILGHIHTPPEWRDPLGVLLGVITANVGSIVNYFFSRQRPDTKPPESPPGS